MSKKNHQTRQKATGGGIHKSGRSQDSNTSPYF